MLRFFSFLLAGATIAVSTATAHAGATLTLDPTGHWEGKSTCKGVLNGEKYSFKAEDQQIHMTADGESVNVVSVFGPFNYGGRIITDPTNSTKAALFLVECPISANPPQGEVVHASVTTKKDGTLKLKATTIFGGIGQVFTCKWKFERVDDSDPAVPACGGGDPT